MKTLVLMGLSGLLWGSAQAQSGKYEKVSGEQTESIELFENHSFEYNCKTQWAKSITKGRWVASEDGQLLLSSDMQLSDFDVVEEILPNQGKGIKIIVGGQKKGQAPKTIRQIRIIGKDTLLCSMYNEGVFAEMEERQKLQIKGSAEQQDSLRQTDTRRHYYTENSNEKIKNIEIETDKYTIQYQPQNPDANCFYITTQWAEDGLYMYLKNEAFIWDKKQLKLAKTGEVYKPAKK